MAKPRMPLSQPVYDDWGNLVAGGKGLSMAEAQEVISRGGRVGALLVQPDRVIERKQGCWNCTAFDATEVYAKRVADSHRRDVKIFLARGASLDRAAASAGITRQLLLEKRGYFGICMRGKVEGDFVACKHLCDSWTARQGVLGSFSPGEPADPLVEEALEQLGQDATTGVESVDLAQAKPEHDA
jgi:hypothetical protein